MRPLFSISSLKIKYGSGEVRLLVRFRRRVFIAASLQHRRNSRPKAALLDSFDLSRAFRIWRFIPLDESHPLSRRPGAAPKAREGEHAVELGSLTARAPPCVSITASRFGRLASESPPDGAHPTFLGCRLSDRTRHMDASSSPRALHIQHAECTPTPHAVSQCRLSHTYALHAPPRHPPSPRRLTAPTALPAQPTRTALLPCSSDSWLAIRFCTLAVYVVYGSQ